LRTDDGELLMQSPAIIEYLEERYPQPPLLPERRARAKVRGVAAIIGCDVHPLHNVSVLNRCASWGTMSRRSTSGSPTGSAKGWRPWSS
jgi:maleylacetoacetate isomerase